MVIPLQQQHWSEFQFRKIPANTVQFSEKGIVVSVNKSASPLIYKLDTPVIISGFDFQIRIDGNIIQNNKKDSFEEDSYFRLGLVAEGENKLPAYKKMFAADWLKKMFSLVPEDKGLDKVYFYNISSPALKIGTKRQHPSSEFMSEEVIGNKAVDSAQISLSKSISIATPIVALWISIDGDDTNSKFNTTIEKIILQKSE